MKCRNWHKPICVQTPKSMMSRSRFVELDLNPSNSQLSWVIYFSILINGCNAACAMLSELALAPMGKKNFFSGNFYQMVNKIFIFAHELSKSLHRLTVWYDMPVAKDGKQVVEFWHLIFRCWSCVTLKRSSSRIWWKY